MTSYSKQLVVLVGGRGTRLGEAARNTPKPLMPIDGEKVFLDYFLESAARQGFAEILLLAGHLGDQVKARYDHRSILEAHINVLIEPEPMGTGGAFIFARDRLAGTFVAANGDTLFDSNIRALDSALQHAPELQGVLALREVDNAGRYGSVDLGADGRIGRFREKTPELEGSAGLINGGIYALRREALDRLTTLPASIEADLFPLLAAEGRLGGRVSDGYFLDIGLPETLQIARDELPRRRRRALFLDRDGVLNIDKNYVHKRDDWEWVPGAIDVIRHFNDRNYAVVVVTNQAGVAHGYYPESAIWTLHHAIQADLHAAGAFVDAFYYCPYHEKGVSPAYQVADHPDRKPNSGMLLKAAARLNIDLENSLLIGDRQSDVDAAHAAGVKGHLFPGGDLMAFVAGLEGGLPIHARKDHSL
jgi:D-glycero-D-manno-heptose 1,7-bisphosphate phosphatase